MTTVQKITCRLKQKILKFEMQLANDKYEPPSKRTRKHKKWDSIKCERTKRDRISNYRTIVFDSLKKIENCHRAEISLWIDNNRIQFSWSPKDFCNKHSNTDKELHRNKQVFCDHSYVRKEGETTENECEYEDINFSEIFDSNGTWKKVHIRRLVHVLD